MALDHYWSADEWKAHLNQVDTLAAAAGDVEEVSRFMVAKAEELPNPAHLEGCDAGDILALDGAPTGMGQKALIRRAVRAADAAADIKRRKETA